MEMDLKEVKTDQPTDASDKRLRDLLLKLHNVLNSESLSNFDQGCQDLASYLKSNLDVLKNCSAVQAEQFLSEFSQIQHVCEQSFTDARLNTESYKALLLHFEELNDRVTYWKQEAKICIERLNPSLYNQLSQQPDSSVHWIELYRNLAKVSYETLHFLRRAVDLPPHPFADEFRTVLCSVGRDLRRFIALRQPFYFERFLTSYDPHLLPELRATCDELKALGQQVWAEPNHVVLAEALFPPMWRGVDPSNPEEEPSEIPSEHASEHTATQAFRHLFSKVRSGNVHGLEQEWKRSQGQFDAWMRERDLLMCASEHGQASVVRFLLEIGSNPWTSGQSGSAVSFAMNGLLHANTHASSLLYLSCIRQLLAARKRKSGGTDVGLCYSKEFFMLDELFRRGTSVSRWLSYGINLVLSHNPGLLLGHTASDEKRRLICPADALGVIGLNVADEKTESSLLSRVVVENDILLVPLLFLSGLIVSRDEWNKIAKFLSQVQIQHAEQRGSAGLVDYLCGASERKEDHSWRKSGLIDYFRTFELAFGSFLYDGHLGLERCIGQLPVRGVVCHVDSNGPEFKQTSFQIVPDFTSVSVGVLMNFIHSGYMTVAWLEECLAYISMRGICLPYGSATSAGIPFLLLLALAQKDDKSVRVLCELASKDVFWEIFSKIKDLAYFELEIALIAAYNPTLSIPSEVKRLAGRFQEDEFDSSKDLDQSFRGKILSQGFYLLRERQRQRLHLLSERQQKEGSQRLLEQVDKPENQKLIQPAASVSSDGPLEAKESRAYTPEGDVKEVIPSQQHDELPRRRRYKGLSSRFARNHHRWVSTRLSDRTPMVQYGSWLFWLGMAALTLAGLLIPGLFGLPLAFWFLGCFFSMFSLGRLHSNSNSEEVGSDAKHITLSRYWTPCLIVVGMCIAGFLILGTPFGGICLMLSIASLSYYGALPQAYASVNLSRQILWCVCVLACLFVLTTGYGMIGLAVVSAIVTCVSLAACWAARSYQRRRELEVPLAFDDGRDDEIMPARPNTPSFGLYSEAASLSSEEYKHATRTVSAFETQSDSSSSVISSTASSAVSSAVSSAISSAVGSAGNSATSTPYHHPAMNFFPRLSPASVSNPRAPASNPRDVEEGILVLRQADNSA